MSGLSGRCGATLLRLDIDDDWVIEGVLDIEPIKRQLSAALGASFDPASSWAHGYPVHRARLGDEDPPQWLWISPNTVPRGFVRPDDPRHEELKHLAAGEAERFPELPPTVERTSWFGRFVTT